MNRTEQSMFRIARCVANDIGNGASTPEAIKRAASALGLSVAAVCHAVTFAQDFIEPLQPLTH